MKENIKALWPRFVVIALWAVGCFAFFQTQFAYHFFYEEQNLLFLMDAEYMLSYFNRPAWAACFLGDFLTQFYHYLYFGAALVTLVLLILGDTIRRNIEALVADNLAIRFGKKAMEWVAVVIALLFITYEARLYLDEYYHMSSLIALTGGAGIWKMHDGVGRRMKNWWQRILLLVPTLALAYWMFGGLGMLMVAVFEIWSKAFAATLAVTAAVAAVIFFMVAPSLNMKPMTALTYPGLGRWMDWSYVTNAEEDLKYDNEYYFGHYAKVIEMYEKSDKEKTEHQSFFYCLSLARMDMLPSKLASIQNPVLGTFYKIGEDTPMPVIKMINELYYLIGDMTYCERAALLANTFSPDGRNSRMIKRLAEANLIKGDEVAAQKYLRLLEKTLCYHQWALDHTPGRMTQPVKFEIEKKQQFVNKEDHIRLGDDCYTILTQLLDSNPDNLMALDYLLCSDMLAQQKETFIEDYEKYGGEKRVIYEQIYNSAKQ